MAKRGLRKVRVRDVVAALDAWMPFAQAAEWDNVGLLAGHPDWPATRGLLAIDLTDAVADEALQRSVDLLVLYHPPIFKQLARVSPASVGPTARLAELLRAGVSLVALHTALDVAPGGTNDALLDVFDVVERRPLETPLDEGGQYKLAVFVPAEHVATLRAALSEAGAGVIGHYTECSFALAGHGSFRGDETTNPAVGRRQTLEEVPEIRLEMVVPRGRVGDVVRAVYAGHPYEEPAFDLYPLHAPIGRGGVGLGRVGMLKRPMRGDALLRRMAGHVDLSRADVVGDVRKVFRSVTAAAGAFGVGQFRDADSLVLTGEFKHHDALALLRRGVTAVQLGHDASERPVLPAVRARLRAALPGLRLELARRDRSPFTPVRR